MSLPHRSIRRILLWPLPVVTLLLVTATVPLLFLIALLISYKLPGKLRALRSLALGIVYLAVESVVTVVALLLWAASGFGWGIKSPRFVSAHYGLLRWAVGVVYVAVEKLFKLSVVTEGPELPADDGLDHTTEVPLIVMSRHAGPADSLLLLQQVMTWEGRRPRIVAKDLMQLDPALDILLNRLPNRFIQPNSDNPNQTVEAIGDLASDMTSADAFIIFPEGGNFTETRRLRAIDRLREGGHERAALRARALRNVLPPRPAGSLAALDACPTADAVFVAHTGLDDLGNIGDVWTAIPEDKTVHMKWHVVDAASLPKHNDDQVELLFVAWEAIDAWIEGHRTTIDDDEDGDSGFTARTARGESG